jgi:phosphoribosylaminoimidazolecarboxamide formyltransferase / IMP cyclohydrolase
VTDVRDVRRALLAVYDKAGVVELARALVELGVSLVSSGGTAAALRDGGVDVTPVEEVTGFPEMLDGRVKTLHPRIHGGLLADARKPEHLEQLEAHGIEPFDLVVVNLYPFRETVASGAGVDDVIEKIDIGGPAMVRAAAKNFESVGVVVDPSRYPAIVDELRERGGLSRDTRERLAAAAFAHTAAYDAAVAGWFAERAAETDLPAFVGLALEKVGDLRYGENPHQRGALYRDASGRGAKDGGAKDGDTMETGASGPLGGAQVLQGKDMSFNNWLDAEAAASLVAALPGPACVIVKHNNPCGVAVAGTQDEAYRRAFDCDTVSAFGGIVAFDTAVTGGAAEAMREVFTEVVIAPGYEQEALAVFGERPNLRLLEAPLPNLGGLDIRAMPGGALVQDRDIVSEGRGDFRVASSREPTEDEWRDLLLAWTIAWRVKSNTIVLVRDGATVGIGAGQMSRVDSSWIATRKAGDRAKGASLASDAFFPFPDALEVAADAGATAVIHPGGSKGDDAVLQAAEERGMAVVLTGRRHFRH